MTLAPGAGTAVCAIAPPEMRAEQATRARVILRMVFVSSGWVPWGS